MSIRESKGIGTLETWGNIVGIPASGSALLLGTTGSGKTEAAKHLVSQVERDPDTPTLVFDYKENYQQFLREQGLGDRIVRLSSRGSGANTATWNLFSEGDDESDIDEIERELFGDADARSGGSSGYFQGSARQVFAAVCKYLRREGTERDEQLSNENIVRFFAETRHEEIHEALCEHDDLRGAADHIDPSGSGDRPGSVLSTAQQIVIDVFEDDFGTDGEFSIRQYWDDPDGRILVLDFPRRGGKTTKPIYRAIINLTIAEALGDDSDRNSVFVLDEFAQIPGLDVEPLTNTGRGRGAQLIATLQSVAQLEENYGPAAAESILAGFVTAVILRLGDESSISFARSRIGTEFTERTSNVEKARLSNGRQKTVRRETRNEEVHPFAAGDMTKWDPGEGVVVRRDAWAYGRVKLKR